MHKISDPTKTQMPICLDIEKEQRSWAVESEESQPTKQKQRSNTTQKNLHKKHSYPIRNKQEMPLNTKF